MVFAGLKAGVNTRSMERVLDKPRLTKDDWIKAAFRSLTKHGPKGIGVDKLARVLGVTKGSFYWHFKDLADLHTEMVAHWRRIATNDVLGRVEAPGRSPRDVLIALFEELSTNPAEEYGGALAETAIRSWSVTNPDVAREIAAEDIARVGYVRALLRRAGLTEDLATARAAYFYAALVGAEQMIPHIDFPRASIESFVDAVLCPD